MRGTEQADFLNEIGIRNVTIIATPSSSGLTELSFKNGKVGFDVIVNVLSEKLGQLCKHVAPRGKVSTKIHFQNVLLTNL